MEAHKLVESMAIAKVDQRRFHKTLYDLAETFHNTLKRERGNANSGVYAG